MKDKLTNLELDFYSATATMIVWFGISNLIFGCLVSVVVLDLILDVGNGSVTYMSIIGFGLLVLILAIFKYQVSKEKFEDLYGQLITRG